MSDDDTRGSRDPHESLDPDAVEEALGDEAEEDEDEVVKDEEVDE